MIDRYPEGIAYSFSIDSDKFIYKINSFTVLENNPTITKIPKKIMFIKSIAEEDETCPICLDAIKDDCVQLSLCSHKFHAECIEKTLDHLGESCPMCRASVDNDVINNYYDSIREISINSYSSYNSY